MFSISAVGAATLHAFGPVRPRAPEPEAMAVSAAAPIGPVADAAPRLAGAEEPAEAPPTIDLASPNPAVLTAGITEPRKLLPAPAATVAVPNPPAAVPSQPVMASVAPSQPAQAPRAKAPAPARRLAPPMDAEFAYPSPRQGYAFYAPTGYIGVYTRGPDGMGVFRSYP